MSAALRIALDSKILISAMRTQVSPLQKLWNLPDVELLISRYAIDEASDHLPEPHQRALLWRYLYACHPIPQGEEVMLPSWVHLPAKDQPILKSAVAGRADLLVTGDVKHFGPLFDRNIMGVLVERTATFQARYPAFFPPEGVRS